MGAKDTPDGSKGPDREEPWDPTAIDWETLPLDDPLWDALDDIDIDLDDDSPPGAPPDPSQRTWRHPSEVAAGKAHLERGERDDAQRLHPSSRVPAYAQTQFGATRSRNGRVIVGMAAGALVAVTLTIQSIDRGEQIEAQTESAVAANFAVGSPNGSSGLAGATPPPTLSASDWTEQPAITQPGSEWGGSNSPKQTASSVVGTAQSQVLERVQAPPLYAFEIRADGDQLTAVSLGTALRLEGMAPNLLVTSAAAVAGHNTVAVVQKAQLGNSAKADRAVEAVVAGTDKATDIALLRLEVSDDTDRDVARTGLAITGDQIQVRTGTASKEYWGKILSISDTGMQTSVAAPPGHRGSAVVDEDGRVVGIVLDGSTMLADALSVETALEVAQNLAAYGHASPNWLGMSVRLTDDLVEVTGVVTGGPAAAAGLAAGDRLLGANGDLITDPYQLAEMVKSAEMSAQFDVVVGRDGEISSLTILIGERPPIKESSPEIET